MHFDFWNLLPALHGHSVGNLFSGATCCRSVSVIIWEPGGSFPTSGIHPCLDLGFSQFIFTVPGNLLYTQESKQVRENLIFFNEMSAVWLNLNCICHMKYSQIHPMEFFIDIVPFLHHTWTFLVQEKNTLRSLMWLAAANFLGCFLSQWCGVAKQGWQHTTNGQYLPRDTAATSCDWGAKML